MALYNTIYVFISTSPFPGHAFVAFGNDSGPDVVFGQGGTDWSLPGFGPTSDFSRQSWSSLKNGVVAGQIYYVFTVRNDKVMDAYNYINDLFWSSDERPAEANQNSSEHRNRSYNVITQNCSTLVRDTVREAGLWNVSPSAHGPQALYNGMTLADAFYGDISRSMLIGKGKVEKWQ
jgi:hypothetical protein